MVLKRKSNAVAAAADDNTVPNRLLKAAFFAVLLLLTFLLSYSTLSSDQLRSLCLSCAFSPPPLVAEPPFASFAGLPTNLSHLFFALSGSAHTWPGRRNYSELWWRPGETRGAVWLDEEPPTMEPAAASRTPPHRVSAPDARFGDRAQASRLARIVKEAFAEAAVAAEAEGEVRWLVMGDDDTLFFVENLVAVLGRYDHREPYYVGGPSESVEQDVIHSYGMAFGGGGFAVSLPAAREVSRLLDGCLVRYAGLWGGDGRVHACLSELGIPLTRELGFHQVDLRGSLYGFLAAHPVAPVVSLHHLDYVDSIFPESPTQLGALARLVAASRVDPARMLQQSICYERSLNWSVSVSWGYAAEVYPLVLPPVELEVPVQTFRTWRSWQDGPFTFKTRPRTADACRDPVVFFLDSARGVDEGRGSVVEYRRRRGGDGGRRCDRPEHVAASKLEVVRVTAPRLDPAVWKRAPRRWCCEVKRSWWGTRMDVLIHRCQPGESLTPPW